MSNGDGPVIDLAGTKVTDEILRRMNHEEWLTMFAQVLEKSATARGQITGVPMTPMRQGAIARVRYARDYIALLKKDAELRDKALAAAKAEIRHTLELVRRVRADMGTMDENPVVQDNVPPKDKPQ